MKIKIAVFIVVFVCVASSTAYAQFQTGNDLYKNWLEYKKFQTNTTSNFFNAGYYLGFVAGIAESWDLISLNIPEGVTQGYIADIVGKYLEEHPEERHLAASASVMKALQTAFPKKAALPGQTSEIKSASISAKKQGR